MTTAIAFPENAGYEKNIRPAWTGDVLSREHVLPGGIKLAAAQFNSADAVKVVVGAAGALANATSVPVAALSAEIPVGALIPLGAANSKKFAYLSATAPKDAVALVVQPLATAVVDGDTGYYNAPGNTKRVRGGTAVGLTNAELEGAHTNGIEWGPAADTDDVVRLLAYDVPDVDDNNDGDLLRPGTLIKVNFLPGWSSLSTTVKNKIRAAYDVTVGAPGEEVAAS